MKIAEKDKTTRAQRQLLNEMAKDERVLLVQRHPRMAMAVQYSINSFPLRRVRAPMVAILARKGYLTLTRRGYYTLTMKGQLLASVVEEGKRS
jgi:hypothetical protein